MENLSGSINTLFVSIINSPNIDFGILHRLTPDILPPEWVVKGKVETSHYRMPIGIPLGYLSIDENKYELDRIELTGVILSFLKGNNYTINGIINIIILISRLDNLFDDEKDKIIKDIIDCLNKEHLTEMVNAFINELNSKYSVKDIEVGFENNSIKNWERRVNIYNFEPSFNDPTEILLDIVYIRKNDIDILSLLKELAPLPRSFMTYNRAYLWIEISEDKMISFLKDNPQEIPYYTYVLLNSTTRLSWCSVNLIDYLINNHWQISAKWIFRYSFSDKKKLNEENDNSFRKSIENHFHSQFANNNPQTILSVFDWPDDYYALGGWSYNHKDKTVNTAYYNGLCSGLSSAIRKTKNSLREYLINPNNIYDDWFFDINDKNVMTLSHDLLVAIISCGEKEYDDLTKALKDLSYELKTLLYGSYNSISLSKKIIYRLLVILLAVEKSGVPQNQDRISSILDIFKNTFMYGFISTIERDEVIWNYASLKHNEILDVELYLIISKIRHIEASENRIYYLLLFEIIEKYSTIEWPVFQKHIR